MDSMKEALMKKRRSMISLHVSVDPDSGEADVQPLKGSDLAPPRQDSMDEGREAAKLDAQSQDDLKVGGPGHESSADQGMDEQMFKGLQGNESAEYAGKPRSLFERAMMEHKKKGPRL